MRTYKPSNRTPTIGILILFMTAVIGGLLLGLLTFAISNFIYLIFFFPIGLGFISGMLMHMGIRKGKVRSPIIGAVFGIVLGLIIYGTYRYAGYDAFLDEGREIISQEMEQQFGSFDTSVADSIIEEILFEETGSTGFWGYLKLSASEGTSFGRLFRSQTFEIGSTLTWIYWIVELIIIAGFSAHLAYDAASDPFCETCQNWYKPKKYLGGVKPEQANTLFQEIKGGHFSKVGELIQEEVTAPSVDISIQDCHCAANDSILVAEQVSLNKKGKLEYKTILQGIITSGQREILSEFEKLDDLDLTITNDASQQSMTSLKSEAGAIRPTQGHITSELTTEKDYTKTRIVLIIMILALVLPCCISFLYYIVQQQ